MPVTKEEILDLKTKYNDYRKHVRKVHKHLIKLKENIMEYYDVFFFSEKNKSNKDVAYSYNRYHTVVYLFDQGIKNKLLQGKTIEYPVFGKLTLGKKEISPEFYKVIKSYHDKSGPYYVTTKFKPTRTAQDFRFYFSKPFEEVELRELKHNNPYFIYRLTDIKHIKTRKKFKLLV